MQPPLEAEAGLPVGACPGERLSPRAATAVLEPSALTAAVNCSTAHMVQLPHKTHMQYALLSSAILVERLFSCGYELFITMQLGSSDKGFSALQHGRQNYVWTYGTLTAWSPGLEILNCTDVGILPVAPAFVMTW